MAGASVFFDTWKILIQAIFNLHHLDADVQVLDASEKPVKNMSSAAVSIGYKHKSKNAVKISLLTTQAGVPLGLDVTGAKGNDVKRLENTLTNSLLKSPKNSHSKVLADKGYYGSEVKKWVAQTFQLELITPAKSNSLIRNTRSEKRVLKGRNVVERTFQKIYVFKRVDVILDRSMQIYLQWCYLALAFVTLINVGYK